MCLDPTPSGDLSPPQARPRRDFGLRGRLTGAFALLAVAPILALGGLAIRNARWDVQQEVVRGNLALIRAIGHQFNTTLQDARRALTMTAATWARSKELEASEGMISTLKNEWSIVRQVTLFDRSGRQTGGDQLPNEAKFSLELANTFGGYVSEVIKARGKQHVLVVVQARDRKGELAGFWAATVDLEFVHRSLREARLGPGATLLVVDGNGREVARSGRLPAKSKDQILRDANPAVDRALGSHAEGHLEFTDAADEQWVVAYRNIVSMSEFRGVRWAVLLMQPTYYAYTLARKATRNTIVIAVIVFFMALVAGTYLARWITRPLATLVQQTKLVADEKFEVPVPSASRRDEVGELAESFAAMVERLRVSRDKLHAQTEFRDNLVKSIPMGVISVSSSGVIQSINPAQERLSGISSEEAIGRKIEEVFPRREGDAPTLQNFAQVFNEGVPLEVTLRSARSPFTQDRHLKYHIRIAPLYSRQGEVDGAVILQEDLSQHARLESQLVRSEKLSSVGVLAAGVAHEINNPLTTILGYANLLLEGMAVEAPDRAAMELVAEEARRVQKIVRNMLDFSRQATGVMLPVPLNEVIERVLSLVAPDLRQRGLAVRQTLDDKLPMVLADSRQIEQVFVNLINNAAQAMDSGGTLQVSTGCYPERRGVVFARFTDTGMGIPEELLPRIFDPFFTTKEPGSGTGLGLAVSHGIISDHEGEIEVQSTAGEGSIFTVWLKEAP